MALSSWIIIANEAKSSARKEELLKLLIDSINWINVIHFVDGCARKKGKENILCATVFSNDHWLEIKMIYQTFTFTTLFSLFEHFKRGCEICVDFVPIEISFVSDPEFCMIRKKISLNLWQLTWKRKENSWNFGRFSIAGKVNFFAQKSMHGNLVK